ncbi:hypothetical protein CMI37_08805 [Candidatus Pacearchaeota archaeon]|nr:hypothetical protein [Candidatus Pacearchaeota archaeon]|tara:strand:- start:1150 stop:1584 length:435 start_codon:yes stop_codon:yes gene_type:complete
MYPSSFNIYKKSAAAQFTLLPPRRDDNGRISKNGAILLEMAPSVGEKSYDWKNKKVTFAFGINDLTSFFDDPNSDKWGSFFHVNDQTNKRLTFSPGEGKYAGTFMLSLAMGDDRVSISLTGGEFNVLGRLFSSALPHLLGWNNV